MEKLNVKVESVTEKGYWAIPEGDTLIRGARITKKELDSIGYTYDYKALFDIDSDLVSCATTDENDKVIDTWNFSKQNNLLARAEYTVDDTVRFYELITCDEAGNPYLYEMYDIVNKNTVEPLHIRLPALLVIKLIVTNNFSPSIKFVSRHSASSLINFFASLTSLPSQIKKMIPLILPLINSQ